MNRAKAATQMTQDPRKRADEPMGSCVAVVKKNDVSWPCATRTVCDVSGWEPRPIAAIDRPKHRPDAQLLRLFVEPVVSSAKRGPNKLGDFSSCVSNSPLAATELVTDLPARAERKGCMIPTVVTDLVALCSNPARKIWKACNSIAEAKERCSKLEVGEHIEDARCAVGVWTIVEG